MAAASQLRPPKNLKMSGSPNARINEWWVPFACDRDQLEGVTGDLVALTTLELSLVSEDLNSYSLVLGDAVDVNDGTAHEFETLRTQRDTYLPRDGFQDQALSAALGGRVTAK